MTFGEKLRSLVFGNPLGDADGLRRLGRCRIGIFGGSRQRVGSAIACVRPQGLFVADGCDVLSEYVVGPAIVGLRFWGGEAGQEAGKRGDR